MIVIDLTGGILSGKSTVAQMLSELGAAIIDADKIGHEAYRPHTEVWQEVVSAFGTRILGENDEINSAKLAQIVFNDPEALKRLNEIMHPRMHRTVKERIDQLKKQGVDIIILEAAVLLEANWTDLVDEVWVTAAPEAVVIQRLQGRGGLTDAQLVSCIHSQMSVKERLKRADQVINTDCSLAETKSRVEELWSKHKHH